MFDVQCIFTLWKISKVAKHNLCCSECKLKESYVKTYEPNCTQISDYTDAYNLPYETLKTLVESINYVKDKCNNFNK